MKNPLTASERRGILAVAAIALLITGAGWIMSTCRRSPAPPSPPEIETLVNGDSILNSGSSSNNSNSKSSNKSKSTNKKSKSRKDSLSGSKTKSTKTYRRRSPRDEGV